MKYGSFWSKDIFTPKGFVFFGLVLFAFLPYIRTSSFQTDTQPHFFVFLLGAVLLYSGLNMRIPITLAMAIAAIAYGVLAMMMGASIHEVLSIVLFFVSVSMFSLYGARYLGLIRMALAISVVVYFLFGAVEIIWGRTIIDAIASNSRTSNTRGLTSLASEPSFLGLVSFVQIVVLEIIKGRKYRLFQALAFLNLIFCASVAVIAPAFVIFVIYLFFQYGIKGVPLLLLLALTSGYLITVSGGRAYTLFQVMVTDPFALILDQSVANRAVRSFGPLYVALADGFYPHGFNDLSSHLSGVGADLGVPSAEQIGRLSNVSTYFLFGFGFLSFPVICYYLYLVYRVRLPLYVLVSIIYLSVANVSLAAPYIAFLIASPAWFKYGLPEENK